MQKETSVSIGNWTLNSDEKVYVGKFDNVKDIANDGIFPGQRAGDSIYRCDKNPDAVYTPIDFVEADYQFSFVGNGYFYGITNENTEVIAIVTDDGKLIPTRAGIGGYNAKTRPGDTLCQSTGFKDFEVTEVDGYKAVKVNYNAEGKNEAVLRNSSTYIFKEFCLDIDTDFEMICDKTVPVYTCSTTSHYINDSNSIARRLAMNWLYPENNDFVYKECDRFVISETYGDYVIHYAEHDPNSSHKYHIPGSAGETMGAFLKDTDLGYEGCAKYSVSVTKNNEREGYEGLFKARNMEFATGIAAVNETDNTTLFLDKHLKLNVNVTNLSANDINFSVRYNIISYDNECVDSAIYYTNILNGFAQANHNIELDLPKYGMYYLNLYVCTKDNEYRECYPFAILEDYEYKHRFENRLGMCATHTETSGEGASTICVCNKLGISVVRLGASYDRLDFVQRLRNNKISYATGIGWNQTEAGIDDWKEKVRNILKTFPDAKYILFANEVDAKSKANYGKSKRFLEETFVPYTFNPAYEVVSKEFPEMLPKMIWQSNCHGTTEWLEAFHESGIWDKSEFIDIHTYSSPSGPDKLYANSLYSMHANSFSNEYAMERFKRLRRRYDPNKKLLVGETGYPTPAHCSDTKEIDIRTGADFNVRIALFLFEAGCEDIIYYCLYDRTTAFNGSSDWNEMYFGAMYNYDYYGVYMPKPWAAAFANLTRRFDGHKKVSFIDKYDEDEFGTLRAFQVETEDDKFVVLWSNIYQLPNTSVQGRVDKVKRIPAPAWENRWTTTETREFEAVGNTVKIVDIMGNEKILKAENGKVSIEVSGSPIYVYGIK